MKNRIYTSFEEVDKDLKVLNLRRQIAQEEIKGDLADIKSRFEPPELLSFIRDGILKKLLLSWLVGFILRKIRKQ
ncbi:MAG: hypothetical protein EP302_04935 [Bacteroidetes bacterium]|jgi:hypothetical protein|nr:MAG: hypothetical protein EP302_04935 [Bacteroidota bacterium]UCE69830.1 MAG: hypothetical protein JSW57_02665 [Flavobacteriaceae bacterium]